MIIVYRTKECERSDQIQAVLDHQNLDYQLKFVSEKDCIGEDCENFPAVMFNSAYYAGYEAVDTLLARLRTLA